MEPSESASAREEAAVTHAKHPSPPLSLLAGIHLALFLGGLVLSTKLAGGDVFPSPFEPEWARAYFAQHAEAVRVAGFFVFASAFPLGLFAVTAASRLDFLGVKVAGVWIALFGGIGAALMLMLSGSAMWTLGQVGVAEISSASRPLHLLAFVTGGPAFAALFGLLVAGVSLAGGLTRRLPKWVQWFGLAIAVVAELSTLSLVAERAAYLLPLARFPGLIWLICVSAVMPRSRARRLHQQLAQRGA